MKAVYLKKIGGPESLVLGEIPQPQPKAGEVLVKIHATAITTDGVSMVPNLPYALRRVASISCRVKP